MPERELWKQPAQFNVQEAFLVSFASIIRWPWWLVTQEVSG